MKNPVIKIKLILLAVVYLYATGFVFHATSTSFPTFPSDSDDYYLIEAVTANLTGKIPGNEGLNLSSSPVPLLIRKEITGICAQKPEPFSLLLNQLSCQHFLEFSQILIEFPHHKIIFPFHFFW